jgi:hypothetical protein
MNLNFGSMRNSVFVWVLVLLVAAMTFGAVTRWKTNGAQRERLTQFWRRPFLWRPRKLKEIPSATHTSARHANIPVLERRAVEESHPRLHTRHHRQVEFKIRSSGGTIRYV